MSVFWEGEGGGVLAPPEDELVDVGDLRRSITDSRIPVRAARVYKGGNTLCGKSIGPSHPNPIVSKIKMYNRNEMSIGPSRPNPKPNSF